MIACQARPVLAIGSGEFAIWHLDAAPRFAPHQCIDSRIKYLNWVLAVATCALRTTVSPKRLGPSLTARPRVVAPRRPLTVRASGDPTVSFSADDLQDNTNITKAKTIAYRALSVALAGAGAALLYDPSKALEVAYAACGTPLVFGLARALGAVHLLAAIVAHTLADAASHSRLSSETYKRLNCGLAAWGTLSLAILYTAPVALAPVAQAAYGAVLAAAATLPPALGKGLLAPLPPPPRMANMFTSQRLYSMAGTVMAVFVGTVAYAYFYPGALGSVSWLTAVSKKVPLGALGATLLRLLGSGAVLTLAVLGTQEDAARRGRLGASTFKALNWGLAALSCTVLALTEAGMKAGILSFKRIELSSFSDLQAQWLDVFTQAGLGVAVLVALFATYWAVAAKKK
jgi:hypothetical protein